MRFETETCRTYLRRSIEPLLQESESFSARHSPRRRAYGWNHRRRLGRKLRRRVGAELGHPDQPGSTPEYRAACELFLEAQQTIIAKVKADVSMVELEQALHGIIKDAGHGAHLFGPPIHGVGIEFEKAPLPPGHAFFHGEKAPKPLEANVVIAVGNCGLYIGPWGVRVEDTVLVGAENSEVLTHYPCSLEQRREPERATDTTIGTPGGCPHRPSGITGENLLDRGALFRFLINDHVQLAGLLQKAYPRPGRVNYGSYAEFRAGLLRHIAMEEKILLPAARRLLGGEPLPTYDKL